MQGGKKVVLAYPQAEPSPPRGPWAPGQAWGVAGLCYPALLVSVLGSHLPAYIRCWLPIRPSRAYELHMIAEAHAPRGPECLLRGVLCALD